jgi:hypothetical protein
MTAAVGAQLNAVLSKKIVPKRVPSRTSYSLTFPMCVNLPLCKLVWRLRVTSWLSIVSRRERWN